MKDEQINLKISPEEKKLLRKAAKNLNFETGEKESVSAAIRHSIKKYAEIDLSKPELFFLDRVAIRNTEQNINYGLIHLQKFIDEFKKVTGQTIDLSDLESIFKGLGKFGSTSIIQNTIREIVETKLLIALQRKYPDQVIREAPIPNLTDLFEASDRIEDIPEIKIGMRPVIYFHCYTINGGVLSVLPDQKEKLFDSYRFYAVTPEELKKLQKVKALCECMNSFLEDKDLIPEKLFTLVYYDNESAKFAPSGSYIKYN